MENIEGTKGFQMLGCDYLSDIFIQTLEQAIDGVVVIGHENQIIFINNAAEQLWGYSRQEALGQNIRLLVPNDIKPQHDSYINNNRNTGINKIVGTSRNVPIVHKNGSRKWGSMSISKITVQTQILYTAFIKDITSQLAAQERIRLLSMVADKTDSAILIMDADWRTIYVNTGCTDLLGYTAETLTDSNPISLIMANEAATNKIKASKYTLSKGNIFKDDALMKLASGECFWCKITVTPVMDENANLIYNVVVLIDITQTKIHEILQHKLLNAVMKNQPLQNIMKVACEEIERIVPEMTTSVIRVNTDSSLHALNAPGLTAEYIRIQQGVFMGSDYSEIAALIDKPVIVADIAKSPLWQDENARKKVLSLGFYSCWCLPIKSNQHDLVGFLVFYYRERRKPSLRHQQLADAAVSICALILEREQNHSQIRQLVYYDSLTTLPNRSLLHANAEKLLIEACNKKQRVAVLSIGLDRFKQINDSMGHSAGDKLLQLIANRLQQHCRGSDIIGRHSADEFIIILPQCTAEYATEFSRKLQQSISQPCKIARKTLTPSASVGISLFPQDGNSVSTLLQRAAIAMSQAKNTGLGKISLFNTELNKAVQERQKLEATFRLAMKRHELTLHYQPQINLKNGRLHGVEALARWQSATLGVISPERFIPLAEECGLIDELGIWAITAACQQLAVWRRQGLLIPAISVNLSPTNFRNTDFPLIITRALRLHHLTADDLTIEITEDVLIDANPNIMQTLNAINQFGIRLAMDDFGKGYSSLSYLRRIPISELKLDRSFVADLEHDHTARAISSAVLGIAKSLQLTVIAEGIENDTQNKLLQQQGYPIGQGYLFSRPLSAPDFVAWLNTHIYKQEK